MLAPALRIAGIDRTIDVVRAGIRHAKTFTINAHRADRANQTIIACHPVESRFRLAESLCANTLQAGAIEGATINFDSTASPVIATIKLSARITIIAGTRNRIGLAAQKLRAIIRRAFVAIVAKTRIDLVLALIQFLVARIQSAVKLISAIALHAHTNAIQTGINSSAPEQIIALRAIIGRNGFTLTGFRIARPNRASTV
jgi:hypothetical protein